MFFDFANTFETSYVSQGEYDDRSIEETLDLGWKLLSVFPTAELKRIRPEYLNKYLPKFRKEEAAATDSSIRPILKDERPPRRRPE